MCCCSSGFYSGGRPVPACLRHVLNVRAVLSGQPNRVWTNPLSLLAQVLFPSSHERKRPKPKYDVKDERCDATIRPTRPVNQPGAFQVKKGKLDRSIFDGSTTNTVEDYIDALQWTDTVGGLNGLTKRSEVGARWMLLRYVVGCESFAFPRSLSLVGRCSVVALGPSPHAVHQLSSIDNASSSSRKAGRRPCRFGSAWVITIE